jgi:GDP-4-dehydro-6-deoxy-D-mannose reductase
MKALVTGVAGFAGNYLAELLIEKGVELYGISQEHQFEPFLPLDAWAVRYLALDICDRTRLSGFLNDVRPDLIFHLAARSSPAESKQHPEQTYSINFGGTLAILEALRRQKSHSRFLLVSSSHVYGSGSAADPVTEDSPLKPETPYAASKAAAEMAAYQYWKTYGIETVRVRAFNHTGPGQKPGFVCPDLARNVVEIERGKRPPVLEITNSERLVDFSDVRDVIRGYYSALTIGLPGEVYNLSSGRGVTVRSVAERLAARAHSRIEVRPVSSSASAKTAGGLIGDCSAAIRGIEWNPSIPFDRTLDEVLEYWRRQDYALSHSSSGACSSKSPLH